MTWSLLSVYTRITPPGILLGPPPLIPPPPAIPPVPVEVLLLPPAVLLSLVTLLVAGRGLASVRHLTSMICSFSYNSQVMMPSEGGMENTSEDNKKNLRTNQL